MLLIVKKIICKLFWLKHQLLQAHYRFSACCQFNFSQRLLSNKTVKQNSLLPGKDYNGFGEIPTKLSSVAHRMNFDNMRLHHIQVKGVIG